MNNSPLPIPFIKRYVGRKSCLVKIVRPESRTLRKLTQNTSKNNQNVNGDKPLTDLASPRLEEPIDDLIGPIFIPSVPIVKRKFHHEVECPQLEQLKPQLNNNTNDLIMRKIEVCNIICDFSDPDSDKKAKKEKKTALKELLALFSNKDNCQAVAPPIIDSLFKMFEVNIYRPFPSVSEKYLAFDEEPLMSEVSWPHLSLVYDILIQYQTNFPRDPHFTELFMNKLLSAFDSCDSNERGKLITIFTNYSTTNPNLVHKLVEYYGHVCREYIDGHSYSFALTPALRLFNISLKTAPNNEMEFYYNIILTNIVPLLKKQHVTTILPLLNPIFDFIIPKEPKFAEIIVLYIVNHWPVSWPSKQLIFVDFINNTMEKMPLKNFSSICHKVFKLYATCLQSKSYKVAEASMKVWDNHKLITLILDNTRSIYPVIMSPLIFTMKQHWNQSTRNCAISAYKQVHNIDPFVFDEISNKLAKKMKTTDGNELIKKWATVAKFSAKTDRELNLAKKLSEIQQVFSVVEDKEDNQINNTGSNKK
ncbi:hypothetical protein TVAG_265080 [Trichomonas vaginalis G3]|uniref:Phosphoprotein phosphatase n=1 Tax=Trichomonas vaginalis (strain ATCC PRA-98 / G3) TaxID=412133 RepID=A2G0R8_TRIV3|nr:protein phosphatase regulator protein [Trichomonas vaginalis G3]EAX89245.1 hypothetical protein TVAG_265080 [Trichomonas vaginalis G3]KAI5495608.1 protein phosphatase regulator protein [Trichomonas vaginalis G3]|eukprot:XP_001302175.1 hypothetical protein [Trichomonas vaginalis G3]